MTKERGVYKRGNVWWISYEDAFERRHRESASSNLKDALKIRALRVAAIAEGRFGLRRRKIPTLREFVEGPWRREVAIALKPSTRRDYETNLKHHLLPTFGDYPLGAITRAAVKAFIAKKAKQQRWDYTNGRKPNPNRPTLSRKTIQNMVGLLNAVLEVATIDYELLPANPLRGILKRKNFPTDALRPKDRRVQILEPEDFKAVIAELEPPVLQAVLFAALSGLRWGEQVGLRIEEDMDFRRNKLRITRSLYKRIPQTPKSEQSERDVEMSPLVRRILQALPWKEGYVFSKDGQTALGDGSWVKRQWQKAQRRAGIRRPIRWHDLRHQAVSFWVAIGKPPKWIATQAGHARVGFTFDRYAHLFEAPVTPREWVEDLLWPSGFDLPVRAGSQLGHSGKATQAETRVAVGV